MELPQLPLYVPDMKSVAKLLPGLWEINPYESLPQELAREVKCPIFVGWDILILTTRMAAYVWGENGVEFITAVPNESKVLTYQEWYTIVAHEVAHSHLHKNIGELYPEIEEEANEWVRSRFKHTDWLRPHLLIP